MAIKKHFYLASLMVIAYLIIHPAYAYAQSTWAHAYGGSSSDYAYSIQQTSDGGYIVAGYTTSSGAGGYDFLIVKLDSFGIVTWQKTYGSSYDDIAYSIQQTSDGGYIVAGYQGGSGPGLHDYWILKLDSFGNVTWQKTYGGLIVDIAYSIQQTSDGGYIVAGVSASLTYFSQEFWILKLDSFGDITWQKTYGGSLSEYSYADSIHQTGDGGYIVAGSTDSFGAGNYDFWVLKLDSSGNVIWQKTYGGSSYDFGESIQQTSDGGYIVAGSTDSFGAGNYDFWVLKLDSSGNAIWQKTYGGWKADWARSIKQTSDGGFIVAGYTGSFGGGNNDYWILKLDSSGGAIWQKTYGGSNNDDAYSIQQTSDGGYIVAGATNSFGIGNFDLWILKINADGTMSTSCTFINDIGVNAVNSSKTPANTNAVISSLSLTVENPEIPGVNSMATDTLMCTSCPAPSGLANNTAIDLDVCTTTGVQACWNVDPADWGDGGSGARTYAVLRNYTMIASNISYGTTTFIDTGGTNGQMYTYAIRYLNGCGISTLTSPGAQAADNGFPPSGLINNSAWDVNGCEYTGVVIAWAQEPANWGDGGSGTRTYAVLRDGYIIASNISYGTTTFTDTAGTNDQVYTYTVRYINGCGFSSDTNPGAQAADNIGSAPSGLTNNSASDLNSCTDTGVQIIWAIDPGNWGDGSSGTRTYAVLRDGSIITSNIYYGITTFIDTAGTNGQAYSYTVRYTNGCGFSSITSPGALAADIASALTSLKPAIDDSSSSTPNGIIETNEAVQLIGNVQNNGTSIAGNVTGTLSTTHPIYITNAYAIYPDINPNTTQTCTTCYTLTAPASNRPQTHWDFSVTESPTCTNCCPASYDFMYHVGNSFSDVLPSQLFYSYIETLLHNNVTNGCTASTYCTGAAVQRQGMTKFLCNALNAHTPDSCVTVNCALLFADVPATNPFCPYIEAIHNAGIASGCQSSPLLFCPASSTQRQAMAKFVCNAMNVADPGSCSPTSCTGMFSDVPASNIFCSYIEALASAGIVSGCAPSLYCPAANVFRDQMAKFLVNAFGLSL